MTGLGSNANSAQAFISLSAYINPQGSSSQQNVFGYRSADTLTAAPPSVLTVTVAASTTTAFNLATIFSASTAPLFVVIGEVAQANAGLGFQVKFGTSGSNVGVGANGFIAYLGDTTTALPTAYITNASSTTELVLTIGVLTQ